MSVNFFFSCIMMPLSYPSASFPPDAPPHPPATPPRSPLSGRCWRAAESPDPATIPSTDLVGVTVTLITCCYKAKEFIRVGYYVNNEHNDPAINAEIQVRFTLPKGRLLCYVRSVYVIVENKAFTPRPLLYLWSYGVRPCMLRVTPPPALRPYIAVGGQLCPSCLCPPPLVLSSCCIYL